MLYSTHYVHKPWLHIYTYTPICHTRTVQQGWEFAHRFSERIALFCPKMSEWAIRSKKLAIHSFTHFWWVTWAIRSQLLISSDQCEGIAHGRSFLVNDLSDLLTISHFWWATWAICSHRLEEMSDCERIAHQKRGNERKWAIHSFFNNFFLSYIKHT